MRPFGPGAVLDHIAIVVRSIKDVCPNSEIILDPIQKVSVAFVVLNGLRVELLEPASEDSPVSNSLKKGLKLVHLCFAVPNVEDSIVGCKKFGFRHISGPVPAKAFDDRRIAWVYNDRFGLFELLETK